VGVGVGEGLGGLGGAVGCIWHCQVHGHRGEAAKGRFPGGRPTRPPGNRKGGDVVASWRRRSLAWARQERTGNITAPKQGRIP